MPNYIVLRLTPSAPMAAADFTNLLTGLTINVFDISYANPKAGLPGEPPPAPLGTATFNAPAVNPALLPFPILLPLPPGVPLLTYPANTQIAQHFTAAFFPLPLPLGSITGIDFQSVATAVIKYVAPVAEYPPNPPGKAPDLRVQFVRGGRVLIDPNLYYDVTLSFDPADPFPPELNQGLAESDVAAYVELPEALDPNLSQVLIPSNGNPPNYSQLLAAVDKVLASDPGPAGHTLSAEVASPSGPLTVERCRNIAYEILWGPMPALPGLPETLENMYTNPPNDGTNSGSSANPNEQARTEFEGKLASHYAIRNAQADRLSKFVFAISGAAWCQLQTTLATRALLRFPVNPAIVSSLATVREAEVILTGALAVDIPAEYFYALGSQLPAQITAEQRYRLAYGAGVQVNLAQLKDAVDSGVIAVNPAVNPAQAARLLAALGVPATSSSVDCPVLSIQPIWTNWKAHPPVVSWRTYQTNDDLTAFWQPEAAAQPAAFLQLVLWALTEGHMDGAKSLADSIKQGLGVVQVADLLTFTAADWSTFFNLQENPPAIWPTSPPPLSVIDGRLPLFTRPGTAAARITAFIRHVQKFFELKKPVPPPAMPGAGGAPGLGLPKTDLIKDGLAAYAVLAGGPLVLGAAMLTPANIANLVAAAQTVLPGDETAQKWLVQTLVALNELAICAALGKPPAFQFSVMEALYARGFASIESILDHTQADFQQALTGTVAYDDAPAIYANAVNAGTPPAFLPPTGGQFNPINDGSLINCLPPCFLSPISPVAYLHDLLRLSEASTCEDPFAAPQAQHTTLGQAIANRRGDVGTLEVTCANLETPLPRIDLVNECLELMASTTPPTQHGVVYNTSGDVVAGHHLCQGECCCCKEKPEELSCHAPATLFAALPEYSTPATPVVANAAVSPAVWNILKRDFSSCCLPYSQALDVSRTYLRHFRSCRYEEMRTFRKCITEFVLDPVNEPAGFQTHLWRYPVRVDIAMEYLGVTPEEYELLFKGVWPKKCGPGDDHRDRLEEDDLSLRRLYGFPAEDSERKPFLKVIVRLPEFLKHTCLTYCEFLELWKSGFIPFKNGADPEHGEFPDCEPCCLDKLWLQFPENPGTATALIQLGIFVRLWHKLKELCTARYSFVELGDICTVLQLFIGGVPNPDFIRQLSAFQILRDRLRLPLTDPHNPVPGAPIGADRTHLLALWVGPAASKWSWCIQRLIHGIGHYAVCRHKCPHRPPEFLKLLAENLDPLSRLAGFDPGTVTDTWHEKPTHTLRIAEVLAKIYASKFSIGEVLFLFTANEQLNGDEPFPLQTENESTEMPLELPDDERAHSLWKLRQKLLETRAPDDEATGWTWKRVSAFLQDELGFDPAVLLDFGKHFFPETLIHDGIPVSSADRLYSSALTVANTVPAMWNTPPLRPFHYDAAIPGLWTQLPLVDSEVIEQLMRVRHLNVQEQGAVRDLYFQPRASLATLSFVFTDFTEAEKHLIETRDEAERWAYFRAQVASCQARCRVLAEHLSTHVAAVTGQPCPDGVEVAALLLRGLFADENQALTNWEDDAGKVPAVTWTPFPNGGAYAALLGLLGTGLLREFSPAAGGVVWRDVCGPLSGFGSERNSRNCSLPTVIPALDLALAADQLQFVNVLNGFGIKNADGTWLGGAGGFVVHWSGAMLIEQGGRYEFCAGGPTGEGERPDMKAAEFQKWRITLKRGQRTWILLSHQWPDEHCPDVACLDLERGAYELVIEFTQRSPKYTGDDDQICPEHTGFQLKYSGPDSQDRLVEIPHRQLFRIQKNETLAAGIAGLGGSAATFLGQYYTSSLRDIRRTYQRAFKSMLFAHRFALSAKRADNGQSELSYMLATKDKFAGASYYRKAGVFTQHLADFDFNFFPVDDDYFPPPSAQDSRVQPSAQREQALFDWWERLFDYDQARAEVHANCTRQLWQLFAEAKAKNPANPGYLLRHLCADARHWPINLRFYQDQLSPVYHVTSDDLTDERWTLRSWRADRWIRSLLHFFRAKDITQARPDLWASLDPSALVAGEVVTGNANLSQLLRAGCLENGVPRLYAELQRMNDTLREHGRRALLAYLCGPNGIAKRPKDLSELLLIDVEAGLCERASRIDDAISAVQSFIQRARLGLEPGWTVTSDFAQLWDARFTTFHAWEACKRRELYKENWVDWHDLEKAKEIEAFQFLEDELRRVTLTIAAPGGAAYWPDSRPPRYDSLCLLQDRDPATMKLLDQPRQGLDLLATPDRDARPTWLTDVPTAAAPQAPPNPDDVAGRPNLLLALNNPPGGTPTNLPLWMKAAIKLGRRFLRVAAAGYPPASAGFQPRPPSRKPDTKEEECVECCCECGCHHPPHVDEYYFWLVDARHYRPESQRVYTNDYDAEQDSYYDPNVQEATPWHNPAELPDLLHWPASPMVRLAWCRVHNGEFQQPRVSTFGLAIPSAPGGPPDISFAGRAGDSLYIEVQNAIGAAPGFRYDLAADVAKAMENLTLPAAAPTPATGGLWAYPFFAYVEPGARLFPWSLQTPTIAVANALRTHCRYEAALKWYQLIYDPLRQDNTWVRCRPDQPSDEPDDEPSDDPFDQPVPLEVTHGHELRDREGGGRHDQPVDDDVPSRDEEETAGAPCCDSTLVPCRVARNRSILLQYLETLLQWSDALMRRNSPEAFEQARLLLDTASKILGKAPRSIVNTPPAVVQSVATFTPLFPGLNPRLMMIYERVADRLGLIHHCLNSKRLRNSELGCCLPYWGETSAHACCCEGDCCCPHNPYRFVFLIQNAQQLAGRVRELGAALLAAYEKGDAEALASLRVRHERELLVLARKIRKDMWRDADWQIQALGKTKESAQASRRYYAQLIQNGLNNNESQYDALIHASMATRTAGMAIEAVAEAMDIIPDMFVGFPVTQTWIPLGTKLAGLFKTIARITNTVADIENTNASLHLTYGGWDRRVQEWVHQVELLDIQIEQVEMQMLGADRRRDQALRELNNQERQIENSTEVLNFLRDKFTNHAAYLWLQKETNSLYHQMYTLALCATREAERAFNIERGYTGRKFCPCESWDNLHEGLLSGERLQLCLSQMEKEYLCQNTREYELTKHISLRQHFPFEFLRLKVTGSCEIQIPEWMFDLDYPGQYMRRIKNVTLTIPCVTGPYTGIHCRLTLLCSQTRVDPSLKGPPAHCCSDPCQVNNYEASCHDPRLACQFGAKEAIATSSGQNDAGLFELNFRDERYLPFEFQGAVGRWRIELPPKNNFFDMETLSDVIMHLNYTSREGGDVLRHAADTVAQKHLPGSGWCFLDIRHDFPDAWEAFRALHRDKTCRRELKVRLARKLFSFLPCNREICIDKMALLFETPCAPEPDCPASPCPCPEDRPVAYHKVKFTTHDDRADCPCDDEVVCCAASETWCELYHGLLDVQLKPLDDHGRRQEIRFLFPAGANEIANAYLFCHYHVVKEGDCCNERIEHRDCVPCSSQP